MSDIGSVIEVPAVDVKTLRDEFAMSALPIYAEQSGDMTCEELADQCYAVADAMLEARKKETKDGQ